MNNIIIQKRSDVTTDRSSLANAFVNNLRTTSPSRCPGHRHSPSRTSHTSLLFFLLFFLIGTFAACGSKPPHMWSSILCTPPLPSPHPIRPRHRASIPTLYICKTVRRDAEQSYNLVVVVQYFSASPVFDIIELLLFYTFGK